MDPLLEVFVYENMQLLEQIETTLLTREKNAPLTKAQIDEVFRVMHTLKGSSAMMEYNNMTKLAHGVEDLFDIIRSTSIETGHWEEILDFILESIDFFKNELTKIQDGYLPDGEIDELYGQKERLIQFVSGKQPVQNAKVELFSIVMPDDAPASRIDLNRGTHRAKEDRVYQAHIEFEEGCGMETVRAFGIVNSLKGLYSTLSHIPQNIDINCDGEIVANGFSMTITSGENQLLLESTLKQAILVRSVELKAADETSELFALNGQSEDAPIDAIANSSTSARVNLVLDKHVKQSFISVDVNRIDKLMNLVGEIVTTESMVIKNPEVAKLHLEGFEKQARLLRKLTNELQDVVMSIRMVPVSTTFLKMQRLVRDMSKKIGKDAKFVMVGEKTEVDKNINDNLADPLMHLVRNCMDHGLESTQERIAAGKSPVGTITITARNTGGDIIVTVADDGRGLNKQAIIKKAIDKGLTTKSEAEISDKEAFSFISTPGFSTNSEVTEFSGRGVGMDVVHQNLGNIGGTMYIESEKGKGTRFIMHIPLTLAIVNGMKVVVGSEPYIIPILNIRESFEPRLHRTIISPDGMEMVLIRGECYRVIRMHRVFRVSTETTDFSKGIMVMVECEMGKACLFVDRLVDEQQVVIKPIPANISKIAGRIKGIAGCTIMGDGTISLILDVNGLVSNNL